MTALIQAGVSGLIQVILNEFILWQQRKARAADWKPSEQDVTEFLSEIASDTPEALKAKVAASLGIPWPPAQ